MGATVVRLDASKWEAALKKLGKAAPKAVIRALNRSIVSSRAVMARAVATDLGVKVSVAKDAMWTANATASNPTARLSAQGARLPLMAFGARQTKRGVSAKVEGQRKVYPGTFLATMRSGHQGAFGRRGQTRLPIDERFVVSIPHVFEKHVAEGQQAGMESLVKNLEHELGRAISESAA